MDKSRQDRLILKLLNRALNAANEEKVLILLNRMIERQNKSHVALQSGLNRTTLYRGFSPNNSPKLETVLKVMDAFAMQLQCSGRNSSPTNCARMTAELLNKAFATNNLEVISRAIGEAVHAQANIAEFARRVSISRMSLYRWIQAGNALHFRNVLKITSALALRLEVARRSSSTDVERHSGSSP